jgi:hypothetical protein
VLVRLSIVNVGGYTLFRKADGVPPGSPLDQPEGMPADQLALRFALAAAALSVVLVLADAALFIATRSAQEDVNQQQQIINDGMQANRVDQVLVNALAVQAAKTNDATLRDLLNRNGVTFQLTPTVSNAAPDAAPSAPRTTPPAASASPASAPAGVAPATAASPASPQNTKD